jgi:hypothetical protein
LNQHRDDLGGCRKTQKRVGIILKSKIMKTGITCITFLLLSLMVAGQPANDLCANATAIGCNQTLDEQEIELTNTNSTDYGDDPHIGADGKSSYREDVWYNLSVGAGTYWVKIKVTSNDPALKLSIGLYSDQDNDCADLTELGWNEKDHVLTRCLTEGTYKIVIDEHRDKGTDKPGNNKFTIEVICIPWAPTYDNISYDVFPGCHVGLMGDGFEEGAIWDVYMILEEPVPPENEIPGRVEGTASWISANPVGILTFSNLELPVEDLPSTGIISPPAMIGYDLEEGLYWLVMDDGDGLFIPGMDEQIPIEVFGCTTTATEEADRGAARLQVFPNPFAGYLNIELELEAAAEVSLSIYDLQGREVRQLMSRQPASAGISICSWDGQDYRNQSLPNGQYLLRLTTIHADGAIQTTTRKVALMQP